VNDESCESTDEDEVAGNGRGELELEDAIDGENSGVDSRDEVEHVNKNEPLFVSNVM